MEHLFMLQVLDMDAIIQPHLDEEKKRFLEKTKEDATETAITTVKLKMKEQMEAEQAAREAEGKPIRNLDTSTNRIVFNTV